MSGAAWKDGWYVVPYDVPFRDLDFFGHANNAVYLSWFEHARLLLWFDVTGGRHPRDINFIMARVECDYIRQIEMEPIEIRTRFGELGKTSIEFVYEIRKNGGRELAATGRIIVVLFDWESQSKVPIPEELRRKIAECSPVAS
jgi:acyl-CoA thioester hydrolase